MGILSAATTGADVTVVGETTVEETPIDVVTPAVSETSNVAETPVVVETSNVVGAPTVGKTDPDDKDVQNGA